MSMRAAITIDHINRTVHGLGVRARAIARRVSPATALVIALALTWLLAAGWWNYVRPHDLATEAYDRYQEEVARCRELGTSEARYDCVATAMIRRDHVNFGTAMLVFLPPFLIVFGRYVWREVRAGAREREHARLAELHSRQRLSRYHREMLADRAVAQAARALLEEEARQRRTYNPQATVAPANHTPASKRA